MVQIGTMVVDAKENIWIEIGNYNPGGSEEANYNLLYELPYTAGTGYPQTFNPTGPNVVYTYTNATPANYDSQLSSLNLGTDGTLYFATINDGIFALPPVNGIPNAAGSIYQISTQGAKEMTVDSAGNFLVSVYVNADSGDGVLYQPSPATPINIGTAVEGTTITNTSATMIDNSASCTTSMPAFSGAPTSFDGSIPAPAPPTPPATTSTNCSSTLLGGSVYPVTLSFDPNTSGAVTGVVTATDSAGNGKGAVNVSGTGLPPIATTVVFTPGAGTYTSVQSVTLSSTSNGALILYTTDGSTPSSTNAATMVYTGPISVSQSETITAVATAPNLGDSAPTTAAYVINLSAAATPTLTVGAGTVTIADTTTGAVIYYTTDGTTPTSSSQVYSGPIPVTSAETITAIAYAPGFTPSPVASVMVAGPSFALSTATPGTLTLAYGASGPSTSPSPRRRPSTRRFSSPAWVSR